MPKCTTWVRVKSRRHFVTQRKRVIPLSVEMTLSSFRELQLELVELANVLGCRPLLSFDDVEFDTLALR